MPPKHDDDRGRWPHDVFVHETAVVEDGVELGTGTKVWHHAHIRTGASVGASCVLGKNVFVDVGVRIGEGVHVQNNVSVYAGVELADGVFVGPSAVFTNDRLPRAGSPSWEITPTMVHRGASIGANATIVAGSDVGTAALVAAGAVVTRRVAEHAIVGGNPARVLGWICACTSTRLGPSGGHLVCETCGTNRAVGDAS